MNYRDLYEKNKNFDFEMDEYDINKMKLMFTKESINRIDNLKDELDLNYKAAIMLTLNTIDQLEYFKQIGRTDYVKTIESFEKEEINYLKSLDNKYCLTELQDENFFVSFEIQKFLSKNGWKKTYDNVHKESNLKLYPRGYSGMQTWQNKNDYDINLYIHFEDDNKHSCELWWDEKNSENFKIRNIKSILKRRGLAKED